MYTDITIVLSTIGAGESALSTTFASNTGADATTVRTGAATLSSAGAGLFDVVIDVSNTFFYDSSAGNLLMDITVTGGLSGQGLFLDANSIAGDGVSRLFSTNSASATGIQSTLGLVTRFTTEAPVPAVPLPAALPLLAGSLGLMGFMGWRRRRKAARTT